MSVPTPGVEAATGVPVSEAEAKAGEALEDKTPDAITPDPVPSDDPVPDPTDGGEALEDSTALLAAMATRIGVLENTVKDLQKPDEPPVKRKPWTQRGGRKS